MFLKRDYIYHCIFAQINLQAVLSVLKENSLWLRGSFCFASPATHSTPQKEQSYNEMTAGEYLF